MQCLSSVSLSIESIDGFSIAVTVSKTPAWLHEAKPIISNSIYFYPKINISLVDFISFFFNLTCVVLSCTQDIHRAHGSSHNTVCSLAQSGVTSWPRFLVKWMSHSFATCELIGWQDWLFCYPLLWVRSEWHPRGVTYPIHYLPVIVCIFHMYHIK